MMSLFLRKVDDGKNLKSLQNVLTSCGQATRENMFSLHLRQLLNVIFKILLGNVNMLII